MGSYEVLDFNLYLSPKDMWTAVVTASETGAMMKTTDTSCTVPAIPATGVEFKDILFAKEGVNGKARTRVGHIEIIEMGVVTNATGNSKVTPATWATHVAGTPANCAGIQSLWSTTGAWTGNPSLAMEDHTGGLYGTGTIINVMDGTDVAYDATAIDAYRTVGENHASPGDLNPSLNQARPAIFTVFDGDTAVDSSNLGTAGILAVGGALMKSDIANDYVTEASISASTDMVITFPTKFAHVLGNQVANAGVIEPFTAPWDATKARSCEVVGIEYYDREEARETPVGADFSPVVEGEDASLCYEVNLVGVNGTSVLGDSLTRSDLAAFENGWVNFNFEGSNSYFYDVTPGDGLNNPAPQTKYRIIDSLGLAIRGLPVIGFAAQKYVNGDLGGLLSNYAGAYNHKGAVSFGMYDSNPN
jgi:hypothetical protein